MNRQGTFVLAGAFVSVLVLSGMAHAQTTYTFGGDHCTVNNGLEIDEMRRNSYGIYNESTVDDDYFIARCPVWGWENTTVETNDLVVYYLDNDGNHSLQCQFSGMDEDGNGSTTTYKYSCSTTATGCTSSSYDSETPGWGSMTWTGAATLWSGASETNVINMSLQCFVRSKFSTGSGTENYTTLYGYRVELVNP